MKKIIVFLLFGGITFCIVNCKKEIKVEPEYINPGYDTRNRINVEVNGKVDTDFKLFGSISSVTLRLYDTIPFPRYYDCPKSLEYIEISIPKNISKYFYERLSISEIHPFIGVKQKLKVRKFPTSLSPKNACDYDSTFNVFHGYIIDQDISGEYYKKNEVEQNDLTITSFDKISGKLTGEFNLTFDMIDPRAANKEFPAKLEYRNGKFTVYLKRY
jgi:hypothetical protein